MAPGARAAGAADGAAGANAGAAAGQPAGVPQPARTAASAPQGAAAQRKAPAGAAGAAGTAGASGQRAFIKITPQSESDAGLLRRLQDLLQRHPGKVPTVLFYESTQKLLALSNSYAIHPSPDLVTAIEEMLGQGTVRIK